ncbi:phosphopantetheine-binding protein [Amycolatopsis sp. cg5]|uniref:phosphopantetheine-binding protein n=1 Tax=Amycolatopsis sp. cg5 TaxID=3238802 RepID=UPI0035242B0D
MDELGLDSIAAVELYRLLKAELGLAMPVSLEFDTSADRRIREWPTRSRRRRFAALLAVTRARR